MRYLLPALLLGYLPVTTLVALLVARWAVRQPVVPSGPTHDLRVWT